MLYRPFLSNMLPANKKRNKKTLISNCSRLDSGAARSIELKEAGGFDTIRY